MNKTWMARMVFGGALLWSSSALAISGQCSNCHTMHDSQDGAIVATAGPNGALLRDDCVGCHTGGSVTIDTYGTPMVGHDALPARTLAGGSFYWVALANGDAKGHNVAGITPLADQKLTDPPGFGSGEAAPDGTLPGSTWTSNRLTCAGTYGCHGTHGEADQFTAINGAHHNNASGNVPATVASGQGFRFLQGVKGYEDADWEDTATDGTADHNQYYGVHNGGDNQTISALCARCHGDFHGTTETTSGGAWIRHPSDYDLGATAAGSEYQAYNGAAAPSAAPYSVLAPVGSTVTTTPLATIDISGQNSQGIVLCLSCHRAHGSAHDDLLRWDYAGMQAGTTGAEAGSGCFICHTTKDGV